ncbi:MAG: hypothetical protein ACOX5R_07035 [bacterium]
MITLSLSAGRLLQTPRVLLHRQQVVLFRRAKSVRVIISARTPVAPVVKPLATPGDVASDMEAKALPRLEGEKQSSDTRCVRSMRISTFTGTCVEVKVEVADTTM